MTKEQANPRIYSVFWLLAAGMLAACTPEAGLDAARAYVADPAVGRAALEAALVDPTNGYSARRLERYRPEVWGALPEQRPRVALVIPGQPPGDWLDLPTELPADLDTWRALGQQAFERWPVQIDLALRAAWEDPETALNAGLYVDATGALPLVWVDLPGGPQLAYTCATCHQGGQARFDERALHTGRPSRGAGRLDVTADDQDNPTTITDLRPIRWQTHLHRAATLRNGLLSLAVRIETLLITSADEQHRPPRVIAFALAWYLWGLADTLPPLPAPPAVFERACSGCHSGEALAGPPVPLTALGPLSTQAALIGGSRERGTGAWRVPSLRGVGSRHPLLASGEVSDLKALFDPERTGEHAFGRDLDPTDRAALLAWLARL